MSTRANIIINDYDSNSSVILYSHCDGYPEGVGKNLCDIIYNYESTHLKCKSFGIFLDIIRSNDFHYEITDDIHGDIEFLYIVNLYPTENYNQVFCYKALQLWEDNYYKDWWKDEKYLKNNEIEL